MIKLGTLETDESQAIAINENGRVLGVFKEGNRNFTFLWEDEKALKIIELPISFDDAQYQLKLNNSGQIAGSYYLNSVERAFIWDQDRGFVDLGSLGENGAYLTGFNDRGQAIGNSYTALKKYHAFYYANDEMIDLTNVFSQCVPGEWVNVGVNSIDNHGIVLMYAQRKLEGTSQYVSKSYIWKDGVFKLLLPEKSSVTSISVVDMDNSGNMIAWITPKNKESKCYFINPSKGITAYLQGDSEFVLRNGLPISRDCLQGSLKRDEDDHYYFAPGLKITKILNTFRLLTCKE